MLHLYVCTHDLFLANCMIFYFPVFWAIIFLLTWKILQHAGFFSEHSNWALFPHFSGGNFIFAAKAEERAAALPLLGGIGELFHIPVGISFTTWDCKMQFAILMVKLKWLFAEDRESIRFFLFHVVTHHALIFHKLYLSVASFNNLLLQQLCYRPVVGLTLSMTFLT